MASTKDAPIDTRSPMTIGLVIALFGLILAGNTMWWTNISGLKTDFAVSKAEVNTKLDIIMKQQSSDAQMRVEQAAKFTAEVKLLADRLVSLENFKVTTEARGSVVNTLREDELKKELDALRRETEPSPKRK